jgi:hypothetical protein
LVEYSYLELGSKGIKSGNRRGGTGAACLFLSKTSSHVGGLNGLEEILSSSLLFRGGCKTADCSAGLVHVTVELINDIEPFLLFNVPREVSKTLLGFGKDGLLAGSNLRAGWVVDGICALVRVDGIGRVELGGLISSVGGTLGVRGAVSNDAENGETRGLSNSGVSGNWKESSTGDDALQGFTAALLEKIG